MVIAFFLAVILRVRQWIEADSLRSLITQINGTYAPYVGAMLTFYVARRKRPLPTSNAQFAIAISIVFNSFILFRLAALVISEQDNVALALPDLAMIAGGLHWIVGPVLGVYFAGSGK
jgi:hypothetical protein